jgi:predicted short-subunit dehydrogenase-like oxidoreductase (DUF2520 family)
MTSYKLSFAGAGRVAGALCTALHSAGHTIIRIVSQSPSEGWRLATECKASWSKDLNFSEPTDIIIVAVPDNSLEAVLSAIRCSPDTLVVHTAGSYGLDVFPENFRNRGVFYPLQTFSKERIIDFNELPFLLEASDDQSKHILENLALSVNGRVHFVDPDRRRKIHLAAVFVCNFTNHMFTIGQEIASGAGVPFELFAPLINETVAKALINGPYESQTGPAVRNDRNTIAKHMELLSLSPDIQKLYHDVTQSILQHHKIC